MLRAEATLGERIRYYRRLAGLSRAELATYARIGFITVGKMERDKHVPGLETIMKVAKALQLPLGELVEGLVVESKFPPEAGLWQGKGLGI